MHHAAISNSNVDKFSQHVLIVLDDQVPETCVFMEQIAIKLQRTRQQWSSLQQSPWLVEIDRGQFIRVVSLPGEASVFNQHTLLRHAVKPLLACVGSKPYSPK